MSSATIQTSGKRRWRPWKVLLGLFVALIIGFFAYQWYRDTQDEKRIKAAIVATDQLDPHWRMTDLIREYEKLPISIYFPQAVAWKWYIGWFGDDIGERPGSIQYDRLGVDHPVRFPLPYFKILRERLQATDVKGPQSMRDVLAQMAKEPAISRVPFDDLNTMQRTRYVSNYLLDEMELAAHESRDIALIPLLRSQLKLSNYCLATPKYINHLVGISLRAQGVSGIKRALALGTPSSEVLLQLQQILAEEEQLQLIHILRCCRAEYFEELENAVRDSLATQRLKDSLMMNVYLPPSPTVLQRIDYYRKWFEVFASMNSLALAQAEVLEASNAIIAQVKAEPVDFLRIDLLALPLYSPKILRPAKHLLAQQFVKNCFKLASAEASSLAELRSLIAALACERYRLATGTWPKELTDLQPAYLKEVPLDPYTGKALLYRQFPDGVVVYSVGINSIDDGGDVLQMAAIPKDRGVKLFNLPLRGKNFEEVHPERVRPE